MSLIGEPPYIARASIYNSRNYMSLIGCAWYYRHRLIYNSRNYMSLIGRFGHEMRWTMIYNSRNYMSLIGSIFTSAADIASTIVEII